MTSHFFRCPMCNQPLQKEIKGSQYHDAIRVILWCGNVSRCPSAEAANNGGSGPTEEAAYRALLLAVKHEEDQETEVECEPLTAEYLKDRNEWAKAERKNDQRGCL